MGDNSFAGINFSNYESEMIFKQQDNTMCPRYKPKTDNVFPVDLKIEKVSNDSYTVRGKISTNPLSGRLFVKYIAANPPTYNTSFSGSGLPFANEDMAFENTPNSGVIEVIDSSFSLSIRYPNSYYINMGTVYVEPNIKLQLFNENNKSIGDSITVNLGKGIPFRSLTWPALRNWNNGPLFYNNGDLPVRTQYQILLDSAYPSTNEMPNNFWGTMPPH